MTNKKSMEKIKRVQDCIYFNDPDRIPIQEMDFWPEFLFEWRKRFGLDEEVNIYKYYDMDLVVISPNMDPKIKSSITLEKTNNYIIYKSGYGCTIKKYFQAPMPRFLDFEVKNKSDFSKFEFEDPNDNRRYTSPRADIISGNGYSELQSYEDEIDFYSGDICIFGSVCEARETVWRIIGPEHEFVALLDYPEYLVKLATKAINHMIEIGKRQLERDEVNGIVIWGDIAYKDGLLISPELWRKVYFPLLAVMCDEFKRYKKPIIYHTDGNYLEILNDLIEIGINAMHPNESKAGINVVDIKERYNDKIAFLGNISASKVLCSDKNTIEKELTHKVNAFKKGGYLPGGDDIPGSIPPENFDYFIKLIKGLN